MSSTNNIKRRDFILKLAKLASAVSVSFGSSELIAASSKANVSSVHANKLSQGRVVLSIDVGASTHYKVFALSKPDRLVIDLKGASAAGKIGLAGNASNVVSGVRHAIRNTNDLRIVLDMNGAPKAKPVLRGSRLDITVTFSGVVKKSEPRKQPANKKQAQPKQVKKQPARKTKRVARKPNRREFVVAIDAGHGGKDPGAVGRKGTREKDVVLKISRHLKSIVDRAPGMRAVLVREGDYYVSLRKRMEIARNNKADMFVSIHADANPNKSLKGSSVYILSENGASSEAARFLAKKENHYDNQIAGASLNGKNDTLTSMLLDLSQEDTKDNSLMLAKSILSEIGRVNTLLRRRVESAGFMVLKSPDIPSMLVETAFISNPRDEKNLKTTHYQQKIAKAMFRGIKKYQVAQSAGGAVEYTEADYGVGETLVDDTLAIADENSLDVMNEERLEAMLVRNSSLL